MGNILNVEILGHPINLISILVMIALFWGGMYVLHNGFPSLTMPGDDHSK